MVPFDARPDVPAETTEQALQRVEAECDWSDAVIRMGGDAPRVRAVAAPDADDAA